MDAVFESLPYAHPVAVHFPIAFVVGSWFVCLVWVFTGRRSFRQTLLALLGLALLGASFAYYTGGASAPPPADAALPAIHASYGGYAFVLVGITLIFLVAFNFYLERRTTIQRHPPDPVWIRVVIFVLATATLFVTAVAGQSGHLMVWGAA